MAGNNTQERTKVMMKNFMTDHNNGLSIQEIAEKYGISTKTVYRRLGEIAQANGVLRDELLKVVHIRTSDAVWQKRHEETKTNLIGLKGEINKTLVNTNTLLEAIKTILQEEEEI